MQPTLRAAAEVETAGAEATVAVTVAVTAVVTVAATETAVATAAATAVVTAAAMVPEIRATRAGSLLPRAMESRHRNP